MNELKKVLLVDDDAVLRIGMKTLVDWRQHGYVLIGEASDGTQALELVKQYHPDIVITDMKMHGMDGLQLIKTLHTITPMPYIIVLSSYDDFPLVRQAMKNGASDYLLKLEISPAILLQSLSQAPMLSDPVGTGSFDLAAKQSRTLHDLISRFYLNEEEMGKRLADVDIHFSSRSIYCLLIKAGDLFRFEESTEEEYHTLMFSIQNIAAEIAEDGMYAYYTTGKTGELYIFGEVKPTITDVDPDHLVEELASHMRAMLAQYLDIPCVIGIGKGDNHTAGLAAACRQAGDAVRSRFYATGSGVLWWNANNLTETADAPASIYNIRQVLTKSLEALDRSGIHDAIEHVKHSVAEKRYPRNAVYSIVLDIAATVRDYFEHYGIDTSKLFVNSGRDLTSLQRFQTISEVQSWFDALQADLEQYAEQERAHSGCAIVQKVERLLKQHFREDISLTGIAEEMELTPGYISAQMKKHTGMSFSEYLTRLRINEARKLLESTDWKVYEVAEAVGYEDAFYFSRIFKRLTGVSPVDWRRVSTQRKGSIWEKD